MQFEEILEMEEAMKMMMAEEQLRSYNAATYPLLDKKDRTEMHKSMYKEAYPSVFDQVTYISREEASQTLGGLNGR